jgi:transcriptional regulator with XRE-family HTH domain
VSTTARDMTPLALKRALNQLGLTAPQLAGRLGVTPSAVTRWLQGVRRVPGPAVAAIRCWMRHGL